MYKNILKMYKNNLSLIYILLYMCDFILKLCSSELKPDDIKLNEVLEDVSNYEKEDLIVYIGKLRADIDLLLKKYEVINVYLTKTFSELINEELEKEKLNQEQEQQQEEDSEKKGD